MGDRITHIAGIIFALAFLAILAMINTNVINIGTSVNDQLVRTNRTSELHELQAFNSTKITGASVISAIKNRDCLYGTTELQMYVDNGTSKNVYTTNSIQDSGHTYGHGSTYTDTDGSWSVNTTDYTIVSSTDPVYIDPTASYSATIKKNENDVVIGIKFKKNP